MWETSVTFICRGGSGDGLSSSDDDSVRYFGNILFEVDDMSEVCLSMIGVGCCCVLGGFGFSCGVTFVGGRCVIAIWFMWDCFNNVRGSVVKGFFCVVESGIFVGRFVCFCRDVEQNSNSK